MIRVELWYNTPIQGVYHLCMEMCPKLIRDTRIEFMGLNI
jgi:hypothetical protein